jgi:hypothetical protein
MNRTPKQRAKFGRQIDALERALLVLSEEFPPQIDTLHRFADGIYIREIHAAAGTIFTSVTHQTCHPFVLSKGVADIVDEYGDVARYSAPFTGVTVPGTRRVFMVLEDLVWTTFHKTETTDPDEWFRNNTTMENKTLPNWFQPIGLVNRKEQICLV